MIRPALARAVPSSATRVWNASTPGWSGLPLKSNVRLRTGSRPSFHAPASALLSATPTRAGWSRPLLVATAWPLSAVAGSVPLKAERSSAAVCTRTSPSGQRANGRNVAFATSACAGRWAEGRALSVACNTGAASGPVNVAWAFQAGRADAADVAGVAGTADAADAADAAGAPEGTAEGTPEGVAATS